MLFYWFCEAEQTEPSESPVALWTNGGPGSDSLGGFFTELGPFIANEHDNGATLRRNPFTWNLIANMLYLTHPTGIGYSYSADDVNVHTDESDGADNAKFLRKFFDSYPEFARNDFWLTGETICSIACGTRVKQRDISFLASTAFISWPVTLVKIASITLERTNALQVSRTPESIFQ